MRCWILTCASAYSGSMKIHSSCRYAGQITCWLGNLSTSFSKRKTDFPLWMNWGFRAGATGTGAKKHALIMNRFKLKIVWRFLTIRWMRSNYKMKLEVFVKELHFMLMPYCSRLVCLLRSHFLSRSGFLSFGLMPAVFHPLVRMIQKVSPCCYKLHWLSRAAEDMPSSRGSTG